MMKLKNIPIDFNRDENNSLEQQKFNDDRYWKHLLITFVKTFFFDHLKNSHES